MKKIIILISFAMLAALAFAAGPLMPIKNGVLTSDLNGNGYYITNFNASVVFIAPNYNSGKNTKNLQSITNTEAAAYNGARGWGNLPILKTGVANIGDGLANFEKLTNGNHNVGQGTANFQNLQDGYANAAQGNVNFAALVSGSYNSGFGQANFESFLSGSDNYGAGFENFKKLKSGGYNTGLGMQNFLNVTNGYYNVGLGRMNCMNLNDGSYNTMLGFQNYQTLTNGSFNAGMGRNNFNNLTNGSGNFSTGTWNATNIINGSGNFFTGGYVVSPFGNGSSMINMGNLIYGTGAYYSETTPSFVPSGGKVGINTTNIPQTFNVGGSANVEASVYSSALVTSNYLKFQGVTAVAAPATGAGTAFLFALDNAGTLEISVKDGAGNVTQISPHAGDAPAAMLDINDAVPMITKEVNIYTGDARWINKSREARRTEQLLNAMQVLITLVDTNSLNAPKLKKLQTILNLTENQKQIVSVTTNYVTPVSWTSEQNKLQAEYAAEYTNRLAAYRISFGTNSPVPAPVWAPPSRDALPARLVGVGQN